MTEARHTSSPEKSFARSADASEDSAGYLANIVEHLDSAATALAALADNHGDVEADIKSIKTNLATLHTDFTTYQTSIDTITTDIGRIATALESA